MAKRDWTLATRQALSTSSATVRVLIRGGAYMDKRWTICWAWAFVQRPGPIVACSV